MRCTIDVDSPYMNGVSCIICAHNEAERIGGVLSALQDHPLIAEVIVIDDGSVDETSTVVSQFDFARLIRHPKNLGKSAAFVSGITASKNDILLTLDADLVGITESNITALVEPILSGRADATLSLRKNGYLDVSLLWGFDYISGERVFSKTLTDGRLQEMADLPSYGLEVFINRLIIEKKQRVMSVYWPNVRNPNKIEKSDLVNGIMNQLTMISDILEVVPLQEVITQHIRLFARTAKVSTIHLKP